MTVKYGITRFVFLVGDYAIKVPRITTGWHNFLFGLLANLNEKSAWNGHLAAKNEAAPYTGHPELLCPVLWQSWGGWISIMSRCEHLSEEQEVDLTEWEAAGLDGDDKMDNFGLLDGRIVKLDYGYTSKYFWN